MRELRHYYSGDLWRNEKLGEFCVALSCVALLGSFKQANLFGHVAFVAPPQMRTTREQIIHTD